MEIILIAAISEHNMGIGKDNKLLWKQNTLKDDMELFKEITTGYPVIAGRKNYESIPKKYRPLSDRKNIVLTKNTDYLSDKGVVVVNDIESAIDQAKLTGLDKCFIIGGSQIYKEFINLDLVDKMIISWVKGCDIEPDTIFPNIDINKWILVDKKEYPKDSNNLYSFDFCIYEKKSF